MVKAEKKVIKTEAKKADAKASASAAAITVTKAGQFIAVNKDVLGNTVPADKAKKVLINGKPNTQLQGNVLVPTSSSSPSSVSGIESKSSFVKSVPLSSSA